MIEVSPVWHSPVVPNGGYGEKYDESHTQIFQWRSRFESIHQILPCGSFSWEIHGMLVVCAIWKVCGYIYCNDLFPSSVVLTWNFTVAASTSGKIEHHPTKEQREEQASEWKLSRRQKSCFSERISPGGWALGVMRGSEKGICQKMQRDFARRSCSTPEWNLQHSGLQGIAQLPRVYEAASSCCLSVSLAAHLPTWAGNDGSIYICKTQLLFFSRRVNSPDKIFQLHSGFMEGKSPFQHPLPPLHIKQHCWGGGHSTSVTPGVNLNYSQYLDVSTLKPMEKSGN